MLLQAYHDDRKKNKKNLTKEIKRQERKKDNFINGKLNCSLCGKMIELASHKYCDECREKVSGEYQFKYNNDNRERINKRNLEYYHKHKEEINRKKAEKRRKSKSDIK